MIVDWLEIYYDDGIISPYCYAAWHKAKVAYKLAIEVGLFDGYKQARNEALTYHAETGDCRSDLIEGSYNSLRCCDNHQLLHMVEETGDVKARLQLFVRGEN